MERRHRRISRHDGVRRKSGRGAIVLLVAIMWGACILAGFVLAKYLITPYLLSNREPATKTDKPPTSEPAQIMPKPSTDKPSQPRAPSVDETSASLPGMLLYKIQLGSFSTQANAAAFKSQVQSKGLSAAVVQVGNTYRVVGALTASQDGAKAGSLAFKRAGFDTFVDAFQIPGRQIKTQLDARVVQSALDESAKFLKAMASSWDRFYLGRGSLQPVSADGVQAALNQLSAASASDAVAESLRSLLNACKDACISSGSSSASPAAMEKFMEAVNRYWFMAVNT